LLNAVGKGHDNELFVLLVDLLELEGELTPLLQAVRVALSRHHQVLVVCPWPPGVPPPAVGGGQRPVGRKEEGSSSLPTAHRPLPTSLGLLLMLNDVSTRHYHAAYQNLRQAFARVGVPVVCAAAGEPVALILQRMDRLRLAGRRR